MAASHITRVVPDTPLFQHVLDLHKRNKKTLGFLPKQGFEERAASGTLIGVVASDDSLRGYALFDLPRAEIRLVHLAVAVSARGSGVARSLVEWIRAEHPSRQGIRVSCRRDYAANEMWPKLGFAPRAERSGRGHKDSILTTWWLDFGHPTLLTHAFDPSASLPTAAIDMNVFLDLITRRPDGRNSFRLQDPWVAEELELVITEEVLHEINKGADRTQRESHRLHAAGFRQLTAPATTWEPIYRRLKSRLDEYTTLRERDESDLRHVARASAVGAEFLVTRDSGLVKRWGALAADVAGIRVVQPHTLVQLLDQQRRQATYVPAQLAATDLELRKLTHADIESALDPMLVQASGERGRDLRRVLQSLLARPTEVSVWLISDGAIPLAMFGEDVCAGHRIEIPLFRTRQGPIALTIARQLLFRSKVIALQNAAREVLLSEPHLAPPVLAALRDEYFRSSAEGWYFEPKRFIGTMSEFRERLDSTTRSVPGWLTDDKPDEEPAIRGVDVERRYWPAKVTDAPLPTFLVPIRPTYAEALFDVSLAEQTLFYRERNLGLSREHVYYRSPKGGAGLAAPARIVWYVTSREGAKGTREIVACSRLEEVAVGPPKLLFQRFRHLGVYRLSDVLSASAHGKVMALLFSDTELFTQRVDLDTLKSLAAAQGHGVFLQGPWKVSPGLFHRVYRLGVDT